MYGVWHMTEVAGAISVEKRECSLTESRKRVIHEKGKLYTPIINSNWIRNLNIKHNLKKQIENISLKRNRHWI